MDHSSARLAEDSPVAKTTTSERSTAMAIAEAVADVTNVPPIDLPSLNEVLEADALDRLFSNRDTGGRVVFPYAGVLVSVHADGALAVYESTT